MPKKNILLAMFDVRPKGRAAGLILARIKQELNLAHEDESAREAKPSSSLDNSKPEPGKIKTAIEAPLLFPVEENYWEELIAKLPQRPDFPSKYELATFNKGVILKELERTLTEPVDVVVELASVGGRMYPQTLPKSRIKIIARKNLDNTKLVGGISTSEDLENFWTLVGVEQPVLPEAEPILRLAMSQDQEVGIATSQVARSENVTHSPASREVEIWLENLQRNREFLSPNPALEKGRQFPATKFKKAFFKGGAKWNSWFRFNRKAMMWILGIMLPGLMVWGLVGQKGLTARNNIVQNGNNAVANLEEAKHELENFNFIKAADSFALAYDDLNRASGTLNQLGASFLSIFGNLPGLNKVRAANNIVQAGQNLSKAGENLALAFGTLYKTNLLSFLDPSTGLGQALSAGSTNSLQAASGQALAGNQAGGRSLSKLLTEFKDILNFADKSINRADRLLADIDISVIPSDKQELFLDFKTKIPDFQKYIGEAVDYSDFLLKLVGSNGAKTYLVLLQNNSELRPTGGFPGSYALITFENGALKKIFVDDIYRADAGIKENIAPPIPLQHITPNWGARDAGWFADFPFSARKVIEMFQLGGGPRVDGVLTITPDVIGKIFEIIGPIEMPDYGLILGADNFLDAIQNEVEYEADRSAPKQILSDLQPKFFERLAQQDKDHWLAIFKIISKAAEQKHILAYFENHNLQEMAIKNGLGGEIKKVADDYLQVVFANVKGSKTDFVTENSMNLETEINSDGERDHTLKISRVHNGGDSQYGFYNRDNSAYVKVYVPAGSVLGSIQGQSITNYPSLIGYEDFGFKRDLDLEQIETSIKRPFARVDVFEESDKTVFGFWLVTKPKQTKSVALKYATPGSFAGGRYNLLWQKQSGTDQDQIDFSFKLPAGKNVINQSVGLQVINDNLVLNSDLSVDREVDIGFR